jgi:hypothetical protein
MSDESRLTTTQGAVRKAYGTPHLVTYGDVTKLTRGNGHPDNGNHYGAGKGKGKGRGHWQGLGRSG